MPADYFLEIEAHFAQRRGTPFILNAKDWALMKRWSDDGIPLPVVIEAIDSVFDKNEASGNARTVNSLSYCRHAVKELWKQRRELQIGSEQAMPEESAEPLLEQLATDLERSESAAAAAFAGSVRELVREKSIPRIEERLIELEERLIGEVLSAAATASSLREQAHALSAGSSEKTRARTEQAHLRRLVREAFNLPRLTLFR